MSMIPVNSSAIRAVGYDGYTLAVLFHSRDTVYTHPGVPRWVFQGLMAAASMGAYYNQNIRGRYL
ncbi:MAG: KTSC domain-containing protein [Verrucomicrobiae bacterium]|nr:KTSC domain-containing protein [Verrucomicrobiae bacterium]